MSLLTALHLPTPTGLPASGRGAARDAPPGDAAQPGAKRSARPARKDGAARRRAAPAPKLEINNYIALINGINNLVQNWKQPKIDVAPSDPKDLTPAHQAILVNFHTALTLVKPSPAVALQLWEKIQPDLRSELGKFISAGLSSEDLGTCQQQLAYMQKYVFGPAAYWAAKHEAESGSELKAPDAVQMAAKLVKAEKELKEAEKLFKASLKLASGTGKLAGLSAPADVKKIIDLVMLPGTIEEKLESARKNGIATTAADLVAKVTGATGTLLKTIGDVGTKVAEARKAIVLARGASKATREAAEQLEQVAGKFQKLSKAAKAIGTAASYAAVLADGIKLVTALHDGDYSKALQSGGELAVDAAPLLLGAEVAGPLAVITVVVQAELEVFKLAAAFIRWCKDETVRKAAEHFIQQCNVIAKQSHGLVADCRLILESESATIQGIALQQANREAANVSKGIRALASHVTSTSANAIGAYPAVTKSLGGPALTAMAVVYDENDGVLMVAQQVRDVFHGANEMAKYVKENYTR